MYSTAGIANYGAVSVPGTYQPAAVNIIEGTNLGTLILGT